MRIASFNVESLFERPVAMNPKTKASGSGSGPLAEWKAGAGVLGAFAQAEHHPGQGRLHGCGQDADR